MTRSRHSDGGPATQVRLLLEQLERRHSRAPAAEWNHLAAVFHEAVTSAGLTGTAAAAWQTEFTLLRDRVLSAQRLGAVCEALAARRYTVEDDHDGELWVVRLPDGSTVRVAAPREDLDDPAAVIARAALHLGRCPSCHRRVVELEQGLGVSHMTRCTAHSFGC